MSVSENEIIYYCKYYQNKEAFEYLIEKQLDFSHARAAKIFRACYFSTPLEKDDLYYANYQNLITSIKTFDLNQNVYGYSQHLATTLKSTVHKIAWTFINNKHKVLNLSKDLLDSENFYEGNDFFSDSFSIEQNLINEDDNKKKWQIINSVIKTTKNKKIKDIIRMRLEDKSLDEIALELKISKKSVSNLLHVFKLRAKQIYDDEE